MKTHHFHTSPLFLSQHKISQKFFIVLLSLFIGISFVSGGENTRADTIENTENPEISVVEESVDEARADTKNQPDTTSDNDAIQILRDRQSKIQEGLEKSDEAKKIDENEKDLVDVQIQKENLSEVNTQIQEEVNTLKSQLSQKKIQEENLRNSLKNEQEKNSTSQEKLLRLEEKISDLQGKINIKNSVLKKNAEDIEALSQEEELKKAFLEQSLKFKKQLDEREEESIKEKFTIFFGATGLFIVLYLARILFAKRLQGNKKLRKQYAAKLAAFDVLSLIFYIGFLVWFFFYIKPELVVYLLFLVGAMVMVLQEYIFSMISSVFIVQRYRIGDRIRFEKREGIIEKLTLLKVNIRDIDDRGINMSELRIIPNSQFMKGTVAILPRHEVERFDFKIILPNDLSINEPALIQRIEENVLQKSITVKSVNEVTEKEFFYDIDFSFTSTGHPAIEIAWHETREKSNRIKRKILAEIEEVKKEAYKKNEQKLGIKKGKEENFDHVIGSDDS